MIGRDLLHDIRFGLRVMQRNAFITVLAILTLGLGIGASTAIFTVVSGTLLRPMLVPRIEELVRIDDASVGADGLGGETNMSPAFADALLQRQKSFSAVAIQQAAWFTLTDNGDAARVRGSAVSAGWLETLQVRPMLGRYFTPAEHREGPASGVALIGHGFWQRRFGGTQDVLGRTITLNGLERTIIGVMPAGFQFPYEAEVWTPIRYDPTVANMHYLLTFGRLRPGVTVEAAQVELTALSESLQRNLTAGDTRYRMVAASLRDNLVRGYDRSAILLLAVVGALLLLACVNVASLTAARIAAREGELVVRAALGASRWRQARQLIVEMLMLVVLGAGSGLVLAKLATPWLGVLVPPVMSIELAQDNLAIDWRVMAFTTTATLFAALLVAVLPAMRMSRRDLQSGLRQPGRGIGKGGQRAASALVVIEVAVVAVLLSVSAGILLSYIRVHGVELGYDADDVYSFAVAPPPFTYQEPATRRDYIARLNAALASDRSIQSFGIGTGHPRLLGYQDAIRAGTAPTDQPIDAHVGFVSGGYLNALDVILVSGRLLNEGDRAGAPGAVVVTDDLARRLWPGGNAVGQQIQLEQLPPDAGTLTVVGIVRRLRRAAAPESSVFLSLAQNEAVYMSRDFEVVVESNIEPPLLAASVLRAVRSVDPTVPIVRAGPMLDVQSPEFALERSGALLGLAFGVFGLVLAGVGVLGVLRNATQARTHEFALRKAVGASPGDLLGRVLRYSLTLVTLGITAGFALTMLVGALLRRFATSAAELEPAHYALLAALLMLTGFVSAIAPAVRAARAEPARLLRGG